jgi:hypothetical protein
VFFRASGGIGANDGPLAADVFVEQLARRQQVEIEILLDDVERGVAAREVSVIA